MPRPKLTEEEKTAMRDRILEAATQILHEQGPDGLSIRAIAEAVGVSHMVLYTYFENRDALFAALRERHSRKLQQRHEEFLTWARSGSIQDAMREMLSGYSRFVCRNPRMFRFLWSTLLDEVNADPQPPHEGLKQELRYLTDLIQLGVEQEAFYVPDAQAAAVVVMGQLNGTLMLLQLPGTFDAAAQERIQTEMIDAALAYLTEERK